MTKPTEASRRTLDNGITYFHEHRTTTPVIAIRVFVPGGSSLESRDREGLCHLTTNAMTRETGDMDMYEWSRFVDDHGLKINGSVANDYSKLSMTGIADYKDALMDAVRDVLTRPTFSPETIERLTRQQTAKIRQRRDQAFSFAMDEARREFYGDHPYNHHKYGREETVDSFNAEDCQQFYEEQIGSTAPIVSVVGPVDPSTIESVLEDLGPFNQNQSAVPDVTDTHVGRTRRSRDIDQPTHVLTYPAPAINSGDYVTIKVLDSLLGGGMSSILFDEMREQRSLGYQVGSSYGSRRLTSNFSVYLGGDAESNGETFRSVFKEITERLIEEGPADERLKKAREYLKGNFLLEHETPGKSALYRGFYEVLGRTSEFDRNYPDLIDKITPADIQQSCEALFKDTKPLFLTVQPE
jgi:zinc protease